MHGRLGGNPNFPQATAFPYLVEAEIREQEDGVTKEPGIVCFFCG